MRAQGSGAGLGQAGRHRCRQSTGLTQRDGDLERPVERISHRGLAPRVAGPVSGPKLLTDVHHRALSRDVRLWARQPAIFACRFAGKPVQSICDASRRTYLSGKRHRVMPCPGRRNVPRAGCPEQPCQRVSLPSLTSCRVKISPAPRRFNPAKPLQGS